MTHNGKGENLSLKRHTYCGRPENPFIKLIRDRELENPASFSNMPLLIYNDTSSVSRCPDLGLPPAASYEDVIADVPITSIVAIEMSTNLNNFVFGMSFHVSSVRPAFIDHNLLPKPSWSVI